MKHTSTYELYEVVKVPFPFADIHATKVRPAVIVSSAKQFNAKVGLSIMAMITSIKPERERWASDIVIDDLGQAGLEAASLIRFKLFTLDHRLILGRLGKLSEKDQGSVRAALKRVLVL